MQYASEKNQTEAITEKSSCDCKCKFNSPTCYLSQKWNKKTSKWESKNYCDCKKDYGWKRRTCICENSKYC